MMYDDTLSYKIWCQTMASQQGEREHDKDAEVAAQACPVGQYQNEAIWSTMSSYAYTYICIQEIIDIHRHTSTLTIMHIQIQSHSAKRVCSNHPKIYSYHEFLYTFIVNICCTTQYMYFFIRNLA